MSSDTLRSIFEGLTALGALIAASQVWFLRSQLSDTRRWNRMSFALTHLVTTEDIWQMERGLNTSFLKVLDRTTTLSGDEVKQLMSDAERATRTDLSRWLNAIESYCAAVNLGIADEEAAKRLYGHKFPRHYTELKPYIDHQRAALNEPELFMELEVLSKKWTTVKATAPRYP